MPLSLSAGTIEVISRLDDALIFDPASYKKYLETLQESLLEFKDGLQPTRFVLNRVVSYEKGQNIRNQLMSMNTKGLNPASGKQDDIMANMNIDMKIGSSMVETVRSVLVDIKHPEGTVAGDLYFKLDPDGFASKKLTALLATYGIIDDLYIAHQNSIQKTSPNTQSVKKNLKPS